MDPKRWMLTPRSLNRTLVSKRSKKILDILLLANKEAIKGRLREVAMRTKVRHKKLTVTSLHKDNVLKNHARS